MIIWFILFFIIWLFYNFSKLTFVFIIILLLIFIFYFYFIFFVFIITITFLKRRILNKSIFLWAFLKWLIFWRNRINKNYRLLCYFFFIIHAFPLSIKCPILVIRLFVFWFWFRLWISYSFFIRFRFRISAYSCFFNWKFFRWFLFRCY